MTVTDYNKPLPHPSEESQPFWDGCKRRELLVQKCRSCQTLVHYPRSVCPVDAGTEFDWAPLSGRGEVHSYTVCHRAFHPGFAEDVPYVAAIIELAEGVRMMSNVIDVDPSKVHIGMQVEVVFEDVTEEITLPKFRPVAVR